MMKNKYRKMMEQVSLSDAARMDILDKLEQAKSAKRKARPLRVAVIAACVCLALVGGAFAGGILPNVRLSKILDHGYELNIDGVTNWSQEAFGRQMQDDLQTLEGDVCVSFDAWSAMKEYVGLPLADNPLLDSAERCSLDVDGDGSKVISGVIHRIAAVEGITVRSDILFWGEAGEPDTHLFSGAYSGETKVETESYQLADGTKVQLVQVNSNGHLCWDAFFVQKGNLYFLNFRDSFGETDVEKSIIYEILNAFEF